jgi:pimeloyl-ACP methyl ester carboxylesterase
MVPPTITDAAGRYRPYRAPHNPVRQPTTAVDSRDWDYERVNASGSPSQFAGTRASSVDAGSHGARLQWGRLTFFGWGVVDVQNRASYGDFEIAYTVHGEGPPLVLVPGVTQSAERWVEAGYVEALSSSRRVVAVDPLGHGQSSKTTSIEAYAPDRLVEHLLAVLDDAGIESADVWGYSRGASMAGKLAERHPGRVRRLVVGGMPLFETRPIMEALGMVPEWSAVEERHERCLAGDWSAYWDGFAVPLPDLVKEDLSSRNDLGAISACGVAGHLEPMVWKAAPGVETLAYWGRDEIFHDLNVEAAAGQPLRTATVVGGHAEAFFPAGPVIAEVEPFLDSK